MASQRRRFVHISSPLAAGALSQAQLRLAKKKEGDTPVPPSKALIHGATNKDPGLQLAGINAMMMENRSQLLTHQRPSTPNSEARDFKALASRAIVMNETGTLPHKFRQAARDMGKAGSMEDAVGIMLRHDHLQGGSFTDFLSDVGHVMFKDMVSNKHGEQRTRFSPDIERVLAKYGDWDVVSLMIGRKEIQGMINKAFVVLGENKHEFKDARSQLPFDKIYHLFVIAGLRDKQAAVDGPISYFRIEKNEVINIAPMAPDSRFIEQKANVPLLQPVTLNELLAGAKEIQGPGFFKYDPFRNNCQDFIFAMLSAADTHRFVDFTPTDRAFVKQDTRALTENVSAGTQDRARLITNAMARYRYGRPEPSMLHPDEMEAKGSGFSNLKPWSKVPEIPHPQRVHRTTVREFMHSGEQLTGPEAKQFAEHVAKMVKELSPEKRVPFLAQAVAEQGNHPFMKHYLERLTPEMRAVLAKQNSMTRQAMEDMGVLGSKMKAMGEHAAEHMKMMDDFGDASKWPVGRVHIRGVHPYLPQATTSEEAPLDVHVNDLAHASNWIHTMVNAEPGKITEKATDALSDGGALYVQKATKYLLDHDLGHRPKRQLRPALEHLGNSDSPETFRARVKLLQRARGGGFFDDIGDAFKSGFNWLNDNVFTPVYDNVVKPIYDNVLKPTWDNIIKPIGSGILGLAKDALPGAVAKVGANQLASWAAESETFGGLGEMLGAVMLA